MTVASLTHVGLPGFTSGQETPFSLLLPVGDLGEDAGRDDPMAPWGRVWQCCPCPGLVVPWCIQPGGVLSPTPVCVPGVGWRLIPPGGWGDRQWGGEILDFPAACPRCS